MIDKLKKLQQKAEAFRALLMKYAPNDTDAELLLEWLTPLFAKIKSGKIIPPQHYEFRNALGKEPEFYERHRDVFSAEADFECALEDWESQEWYQNLKSGK